MNIIKFVKSEKIWRNPELDNGCSGLGEEILEKLKQSNPEKVLETLHDSGTHVTVKEIRHQTITVAQNLLNLGVKKGNTVVLFTFLNLKITPLTFACYTIGAPVCFFIKYLEEELTPRYLEMLDPSVIMFEEKFKCMVFKALKKLNLTNLKHILSLDGEKNSVDELLFRPTVDIESFQAPNIGDPKTQPAILVFTSRSTAMPKIVIQSHAMMRQGAYSRWQAKPGSVVMILSDISWVSQTAIMMQPVYLDVKRVYSSTPVIELTGEFVNKIIDTHKVTHIFQAPRFVMTLLKAAESSMEPSGLSSLKFVLAGGDSAGEEFEAYMTKVAPHCKMGRCYGMTEMAGPIASSELASNKNVNGGVLRKGCMGKIIDKDGNSLGPNEIGRIFLKASVPFLGYLKNKKANEETFIEGGWLNTEDFGMMDSDNLLHVFIREKYALRYANGMILIPNVIENIVNKFEGVQTSALVRNPCIENPKQDCGTIFVVFKNNSNSNFNVNSFKKYLRNELTKDQLQIVKYFKVIKDLPRTPFFKVDMKALKGMVEGSERI